MTVIIKGFPTEISNEIELPDMAELLSMPIFFDTDIDDVYKYGTDFQRKLIEMTPLRNNKKNISVLSEVRFLAPQFRSCTGGHPKDDDFAKEWHIDCEESEDSRYIYHESRDIVHLLTNNTTSMTEFNTDEFQLDFDHSKSYEEFMSFLYQNRSMIKSSKMPANKIVTFTNHLHRATNPEKIEFKFMFRIVETNRDRLASNYDPNYVTKIVDKNGNMINNVEQQNKKITIHIPESVIKNTEFEESFSSLPDNTESYELNEDYEYLSYNNNEKFNEFIIESVSWEARGLSCEEAFESNSFVLYSKFDFNDKSRKEAYDFFANKIENMPIRLVEKNNPENYFNLYVNSNFNGYDKNLGNIAGFIIKINDSDVKYIKKSILYTIQLPNNDFYKLNSRTELLFSVINYGGF